MNTKGKAIVYAALGVIGIVGASASAGANRQAPVYQRQGANNYQLKNPANQGVTWACDQGSASCTYQKINSQGETVDANMTRAETGTFVNLDS